MSIPLAAVDIIDDDLSLLRSLGRLLSAHGYRVCMFASAEQYLSTLNKGKAECAVIDIGLGATSGLDLGSAIASSRRAIPLIFMTGSPDPTLREQAAAIGCVAFLDKPVSTELLLASIRRAVGARS
jgi:FixJ family two-component response regulator